MPVILAVRDLVFRSKILAAAERLGADVKIALAAPRSSRPPGNSGRASSSSTSGSRASSSRCRPRRAQGPRAWWASSATCRPTSWRRPSGPAWTRCSPAASSCSGSTTSCAALPEGSSGAVHLDRLHPHLLAGIPSRCRPGSGWCATGRRFARNGPGSARPRAFRAASPGRRSGSASSPGPRRPRPARGGGSPRGSGWPPGRDRWLPRRATSSRNGRRGETSCGGAPRDRPPAPRPAPRPWEARSPTRRGAPGWCPRRSR